MNPMNFIGINKLVNEGALSDGTFTWGETINVTLSGITIVFAMLVLLVGIITIFGYVMSAKDRISKNKPIVQENTIVADTTTPIVTIEDDSDEIIAVISAAVASMYEGTGKQPIIRGIRRIQNKSEKSAWARAGLLNNTRPF